MGGQWTPSAATSHIPIFDPLDHSKVIGQVPQSTQAEFDAIVQDAENTFHEWKEVPIPQKVRMMLKY
jgi:malonate-semialdehyde dehydrogenase (acetylating)/methylmalonate-semialdehyde dehydrogenase